jgi:hypothetical protein
MMQKKKADVALTDDAKLAKKKKSKRAVLNLR